MEKKKKAEKRIRASCGHLDYKENIIDHNIKGTLCTVCHAIIVEFVKELNYIDNIKALNKKHQPHSDDLKRKRRVLVKQKLDAWDKARDERLKELE